MCTTVTFGAVQKNPTFHTGGQDSVKTETAVAGHPHRRTAVVRLLGVIALPRKIGLSYNDTFDTRPVVLLDVQVQHFPFPPDTTTYLQHALLPLRKFLKSSSI